MGTLGAQQNDIKRSARPYDHMSEFIVSMKPYPLQSFHGKPSTPLGPFLDPLSGVISTLEQIRERLSQKRKAARFIVIVAPRANARMRVGPVGPKHHCRSKVIITSI